MGRDLYIFGVGSQKHIVQNNNLNNKIVEKNKTYYKESFLKVIEDLWIDDFEDNGIVEICWHGSRQVCYAICQIVDDLMENRYGLWNNADIDSYDLEMIFSKEELLIILDWLISITQVLAFKEGDLEAENLSISIDRIDLIETIIQKKFFTGKEFEWFYMEYGILCQWKNKVMQTNYDFYCWLDAV